MVYSRKMEQITNKTKNCSEEPRASEPTERQIDIERAVLRGQEQLSKREDDNDDIDDR